VQASSTLTLGSMEVRVALYGAGGGITLHGILYLYMASCILMWCAVRWRCLLRMACHMPDVDSDNGAAWAHYVRSLLLYMLETRTTT